MSSPIDAKRRKLNSATAKVNKPFVSPLKSTTSRTPLKPVPNASNKHIPYAPSTLAHTVAFTPSSPPPPHKTASTTPARTPVRNPAPRTSFNKRSSPEELAVRKSITALEVRIKSVKNDLDTLNQASKLLSDPTSSDHLTELTAKWRQASQGAAEELFGGVKERVQRMGGVAAWRESEKKKYERQHGLGEFREEDAGQNDDADCEFDSQGEELPEDEQAWRKAEKGRLRREAEEAAEGEGRCEGQDDGEGAKKEVWMEGGGDDDAFTIDMMLRSLNIELDVIGYDKEGQRWIT